jgi:hypothetical protein
MVNVLESKRHVSLLIQFFSAHQINIFLCEFGAFSLQGVFFSVVHTHLHQNQKKCDQYICMVKELLFKYPLKNSFSAYLLALF